MASSPETTDHATYEAMRCRAVELCKGAMARLIEAGMVLHYQSLGGTSWYLGLPGRSGTLRVSDHASPDHDRRSDVVARITFSPNSLPTSEDKIMDLIAIGFGRYVLKTGGMRPELGEEIPLGADASGGVRQSAVTVSRGANGV